MFYAHFVLAKKGPLARIWLAAHWDKKLTKAHVFETNIEKSVDGILQPKVKMALRTSGHLLLGVVRIYSRKAKYLLADCNEAFVKIKMAFRPGMVDLPEDIREAAVSAITFPEVFHDFDTPMPELNDVDIQAQFTLNQSRAEEITMREEYGNISLVTGDDGFGDISFEEPSSLIRATSGIDQNLDQSNIFGVTIDKDNESIQDPNRMSTSRANESALDLEAPIKDDGFGRNPCQEDIMSGELFEGGLFETPIEDAPPLDGDQLDKDKMVDDSDDDGADLDRFNCPPSVGPSSDEGGCSPSASPRPPQERIDDLPTGLATDGAPSTEEERGAAAEQTTLIHNEEESFALEPIDSTMVKAGWPRTKRKRKLIVDEVKNISGEEMKAQLSDTTDIITTLDLAPPSKRLMHWKETGGVEKLFALPGRSINAQILGKKYIRHLTSEHSINEDFGMAGDKEIENLNLEQVMREEDAEVIGPRPRGRPPKRKFPETDFTADEDRPPRQSLSKRGEDHFNELIASNANQTTTEEPPPPPPPQLPPVEVSEISVNDIPPPEPLNANVFDATHESAEPNATLPTEEPLPNQHQFDDISHPEEPINQDHLQIDDHQPEMEDDLMPHHDNNPFSPPGEDLHHHSPAPNDFHEEDQEEQAEDETYEQFEERVVNKRAGLMFHNIKKDLKVSPMSFLAMAKGNSRKQVAQKFYTMLVLKKLQAVELVQEQSSYGEITISRGTLFENAVI